MVIHFDSTLITTMVLSIVTKIPQFEGYTLSNSLIKVSKTKKKTDSNPKSGRVRVGFRVSTFLFESNSGLKTNFFSEKY